MARGGRSGRGGRSPRRASERAQHLARALAVGCWPHPSPSPARRPGRAPPAAHGPRCRDAPGRAACVVCVLARGRAGRGGAASCGQTGNHASPSDSTDGPHFTALNAVDENVGGVGLLFCRRDTHVMSASRPILVVARVVEALPRLAADHVPHALAQRLARGLDLRWPICLLLVYPNKQAAQTGVRAHGLT